MSASIAGKQAALTGLAHVGLKTTSHDSDGLVLWEMPASGLLMLRASENAAQMSDVLQAHCHLELPDRLMSQTAGEHCIRWMSPDAWLLSCPLSEVLSIENALRESMQVHFAVLDVSGGYTHVQLKGEASLSLLMKSTGYDVHPDNFASGKVVNTLFAKAQVTLRCIAINHYEILVRRSYSDYLWLWLQRAGKEYAMVACKAPDMA